MTHTKTTRAIVEADKRGYHSDCQGNIYNPGWSSVQGYTGGEYHTFTIRLDGEPVKIPSHRFIMYQMHGDRALSADVEVRHGIYGKHCNAWNNLELGSRSENMMDKPQEARIKQARHAALVRHRGEAA